MISLPCIIRYADRIYWIQNKKNNVDRQTDILTVAETAFFVPLTLYLFLRMCVCVCEIRGGMLGGGSLSVFCM
jgi:hypothetical protein